MRTKKKSVVAKKKRTRKPKEVVVTKESAAVPAPSPLVEQEGRRYKVVAGLKYVIQ